jgi:hypothetical protein
MRQIKFSRVYSKMKFILPKGKIPETALLVEVFRTNTRTLSKDFIEYDTIFKNEKGRWENYKLPKGEILVLLLKTNGKLWTTVRRFTKRKYSLYRANRGKTFAIKILNEEKKV